MRASATFHDSKPHYHALDGLRGVAALMVLAYHLFESFATSQVDQVVNHGYLAVDFFFILSGFVVGYAYDDRFRNKRISNKEFIKRRLIRLQPMVVMGALIGAICFYFAEYEAWDVRSVGISALLWATLLNILLIPVAPKYEIRGNGEMYPLNGPSWSLFFEYLGNLIYMWVLRKLSNKALTFVVGALAIGIGYFAIWGPFGGIGAGWTMDTPNMIGGLLRIFFSFSAGLLISRKFKPLNIRGGFWISALIIVVLLSMPRIGGEERFWMNGIYETICILIIFPLLVVMGASDSSEDMTTKSISKLLGDISYPLYMVHYPFLYLYYSYVKVHGVTFQESLPQAALFYFGSIVVAILALKLYDEPIRRWLSKKYITPNKS